MVNSRKFTSNTVFIMEEGNFSSYRANEDPCRTKNNRQQAQITGDCLANGLTTSHLGPFTSLISDGLRTQWSLPWPTAPGFAGS